MENKNSYFLVDLKIPETQRQNHYQFDRKEIRNSMDLILASMGVEEDPREYRKEDETRIISFFKTNNKINHFITSLKSRTEVHGSENPICVPVPPLQSYSCVV